MHALRAARARLASFRTARRTFIEQRPLLRGAFTVLYWLPLGIFATEYIFNIKSVAGRSMQVRVRFSLAACHTPL